VAFGVVCPLACEGLFLHLNARKHSESVLALGNLILEKSSSGKADFGLPSCLTVRLAELSHSLVIGHQPDLRPLPREMAINEKKLPIAKHISKLEEEIVSQWFCQYVRFLLSGSAIRDLNPSILNK